MNAFAALIDALTFTPSRNGKVRLIRAFMDNVPDPERGWALAALTDSLRFDAAKPGVIRKLVLDRVDPALFAWSYDYVGDLAETVSLIWPAPGRTPSDDHRAQPSPSLTDVVEALRTTPRARLPERLAGWLDALDAPGRYAVLKLITGALRVGVSARLAKTALAEMGGRSVDEVEEVWHALTPPYVPLFSWLEGRAPRPASEDGVGFRPTMLAHPLEDDDLASLDAAAYRAEWKWDGIRVQLASRSGEVRLFTRTGDDISAGFPDVVQRVAFDAVLDGELLVVRDGLVAPFNDLQQRLNRKLVSPALVRTHPAWIRLYDLLVDGDADLRPLPFDARRARLESWFERYRPPGMDLSPLIPFADWDALAAMRAAAREASIEGLMLKRGDSAYVAGRPKGPWFKWKRGPLTLDCVLMYAQRGHGKRSSFYSDFTFGAWREGELVPVGKAYFGFTDAELIALDRWVRNHTVKRFGPVREVEPLLVFEVAFDSVHRSPRHKSGLAMRFPRIGRIRWDKPAAEADHVAALERLIT